jgi:5-formyltetrahydrofolate cyclo-ligase
MKTEKQELRSLMRQEIAEFSNAAKKLQQFAMEKQLYKVKQLTSGLIATYLAADQEPDILTSIGPQQMFLPRFNKMTKLYDLAEWSVGEPLNLGPYDIPEPIASAKEAGVTEVALCFIPGLAFDKLGGRLGRGGGFYDRLLVKYSIGIKVGVCFNFQVCEEVPVEKHDLKMDYLLTATEFIKCG